MGNAPFTFDELITDLSFYNLQYAALGYSSIKLKQWLKGELPPPTDSPQFKLTYAILNSHIDEFTNSENKSPMAFRDDLMKGISNTLRNVFLNLAYEAIKNYNDNNYGKGVLDKLYQHDWFLMLFALRNNASHYENYGRVIFPKWRTNYPKEITWEGLTITPQTKGEDVEFKDDYAIRLINYTLDHLVANRSIYG